MTANSFSELSPAEWAGLVGGILVSLIIGVGALWLFNALGSLVASKIIRKRESQWAASSDLSDVEWLPTSLLSADLPMEPTAQPPVSAELTADSSIMWGFGLGPDERWQRVDVHWDSDELEQSVRDELIAGDPVNGHPPVDADKAEIIAHEFYTFNELAWMSDATALALLRPEWDSRTEAILLAHELPAVELGHLAEWLKQTLRSDAQDSQVRIVQLPAGPSVRVWAWTAGDEDNAPVESVTHYCLVPDRTILRLEQSWTDRSLSQELVELADSIASQLRFIPESQQ